MTQVVEAKLDDKEVCRTVNFEFTCDECKEEQKTNPTKFCEHLMYMRPHIYNMHAIRVANAIFGEDSDAFRREMMGTQAMGMRPLNDPVKVDLIVNGKKFTPENQPHYIFVACDPNGASRPSEIDNTSDYAILSVFLDESRFVVSKFFYFFLFSIRSMEVGFVSFFCFSASLVISTISILYVREALAGISEVLPVSNLCSMDICFGSRLL